MNLAYPSNNFDGTLVGPSWSDGRIGNALSFDGQDDRVELGAIDITGSALTIMAWINITAFTGSSSDGRIISKANDTAESGHYWMLSTIDSSGTKLRFRLKTGSTTTTLIGGDVAANQWVHVAVVYDGSFMRLYKDAGEVASVAKSGAISTNNAVSAWIGHQPPDDGLRPWNGKIDEVRIYEEALTAQEIQFAMNNGNAFPQVSLTSPAHNQQFTPGETVQLSATASDADGTVALVEFYAGNNKIGEGYTSPYTAQWSNPAEGIYQITAKATDNEASYTISTPPHQIRVGSGGPTQGWQHKSTETGDLDTPTTSGDQQTATLVLDINRDGITDFVITDRSTQPSVVWYESSANGSWIRRVADNNSLKIEAGGTYTDIDGDGDPDIVFAGDGSSNKIWWWENPYPDYDPDTPWQKTHDYARRIEVAANKMNERYLASIDSSADVIRQLMVVSESDTSARVDVDLVPSEERTISSVELAQWFREELGVLEGVRSVSVDAQAGPGGVAVDVEVSGLDLEGLRAAAADLKQSLSLIQGVQDISDSFNAGGQSTCS